jgi:hypothetical protein
VQSVNDILADAHAALDLYPYYADLAVLSRGKNHCKIRLLIRENLFVQANRNVLAAITNFALIHEGQRLFGRDEYHGQWHVHPVENPAQHDRSVAGQKAVTLAEFLAEVDIICRRTDLAP